MKKSFKYALLTTFSLIILSACVDLDEIPEGALAPESFFKTEADFDAALIGITAPAWQAWSGYTFDFGMMATLGGGADDVGSTATDFSPYERFNPDPNSGLVAGAWRIHYAMIGNANALISNADNADGIPAEKLGELVGQAKFWRAFAYFQLTQYFGEVPIITTENVSNADKVGQSPIADIYAVIVQDLKDAEAGLPASFPERIKPTKWAAKSLLAKVYLTMAGWPLKDASTLPLAAAAAKEVIDSGIYTLEGDFKDLWLEANNLTNSEYIFFFKGVPGAWPTDFGSHFHHSTRHPKEGGWGNWHSEAAFFNKFPVSYRKDVSFTTSWPDGTSFPADVSVPYVAKFRDGGAGIIGFDDTNLAGAANSGTASYVHMRFAEVLLIYAEATGSALGAEALNQVRRRANNLPINTANPSVDWPSVGPADFDTAVIEERAWELAFEDKRWFDLVRKEMLVEVKGDEYPHINQNYGWLPKPATEVLQIEGLDQNTY
ncbi:RagB/SusD family nutrient uptake outer membrane protein [Aureibaculum sp. 2210JD6-5]|uniref:RagB/SusD family nutrient uptake outer membrane protein n=1 Tax=Aureibaculum sp. 2210JD6-5 TaxID=3103957 RepID=UPI002AADB022|nr:RagB/SusD family nutrient uptake outer membrane protein [Aureibaculum sp. 2210JD6-5]MDY7396311.1 RagB/SusD family nutrient uptake outer membrane protein [Aureibaculum sp. 2210JD6-5]